MVGHSTQHTKGPWCAGRRNLEVSKDAGNNVIQGDHVTRPVLSFIIWVREDIAALTTDAARDAFNLPLVAIILWRRFRSPTPRDLDTAWMSHVTTEVDRLRIPKDAHIDDPAVKLVWDRLKSIMSADTFDKDALIDGINNLRVALHTCIEKHEQDAQIARQDCQLKQHDAQIAGHDGQLKQHDAQIAGHDGQLKAVDAQIAGHDGQLKQHDAQIAGHDGQLKAVERDIAFIKSALVDGVVVGTSVRVPQLHVTIPSYHNDGGVTLFLIRSISLHPDRNQTSVCPSKPCCPPSPTPTPTPPHHLLAASIQNQSHRCLKPADEQVSEVSRRFTEFDILHQSMLVKHQDLTLPELPQKKLVSWLVDVGIRRFIWRRT